MGVRRRRVAIGLISIALAMVVACSSAEDEAGTSASMAAESSGVADSNAAASTAADESAPSFAVDVASAPPGAVGRQVVSTANMTIRADDIAAAKEQAAAAVEAAGGYVYAEQGQFGDHPSATVTLKVPPDRFRAVLAGLGKLGTVDTQDVATDDVTEQVIDLDSRIASAEVSVTRVRGFLDRATNVLEISSFESELLRRETDLEQLRGQKRALDGRVDLATIVLTVQPPPAVAEPPTDKASDLPGFVDGLAAGWRAFISAITVVLVVIGAVLPFVPIIALVVAGVWLWRRRGSEDAGLLG